MSFALTINSAKGLPYVILQVEFSSTCIGMENLECAVLPPGINKAAIPLDATVRDRKSVV